MEDVVVVTKDDKGKIKLHQAVNLTAAGAVGGGLTVTLPQCTIFMQTDYN